MKCVVLAESSDYLITYYGRDSRRLVVTFDAFGASLSRAGFGSDYVASKGWSNIHVSQGKNSQYQGLSLGRFERVVRDVC